MTASSVHQAEVYEVVKSLDGCTLKNLPLLNHKNNKTPQQDTVVHDKESTWLKLHQRIIMTPKS